MWLVDLNYKCEYDWPVELSDNKLSDNKPFDNKLSDNKLSDDKLSNNKLSDKNLAKEFIYLGVYLTNHNQEIVILR